MTPDQAAALNKDLERQPDEDHLRALWERFSYHGPGIMADLPAGDVVALLRAFRIQQRRSAVQRYLRAEAIGN